ncbi:MAG TPA: glutamate racemase [Candidatus Eremiobacteraceae bacterium]|nr:glutamate racemase [Candidatus Eremiobacteraceae bacterium]
MTALARSVAMLDSGLGGLSVLTALRQALHDVDVVYFADTARVPYGDRTLREVAAFGQQIIERLRLAEPGLIIVASGTTCAAFEAIAWKPDGIPMLGVVASGTRAAIPRSASGRIGVIATAATIDSGIFERRLKEMNSSLSITSVGAPKLVPLVESGKWASDDAKAAVDEYCQPFRAAACDAVILGCTHFPHLHQWFERSLGADVALIDPAIACAEDAAKLIGESPAASGSLTFEVSGNAAEFAQRAFELAGVRAQTTRHVNFLD